MSAALTFSARLPGETIAEGPARLAEFPVGDDLAQPLASKELIRAIKDISPGEFALDSQFLPQLSPLTRSAEIVQLPGLEQTRESSAHEVFFGQMLLNADDDIEHSTLVAVKPLDTNRDAAHEYAATTLIASGEIPGFNTFIPLGITRLADTEQPAILSLYALRVRTMDGVFLDPESMRNTALVDKALGRAAVYFARIHQMMTHGDSRARNTPWDFMTSPDITFVNDLESVRFLEGLSREEIAEAKLDDIRRFVGSLFEPETDTENGFELPLDYEDRIKQNFGLVYIGARHNMGDRRTPKFDDIADIIAAERSLS